MQWNLHTALLPTHLRAAQFFGQVLHLLLQRLQAALSGDAANLH